MNRRQMLSLFGCGVIGLATDWSGALKGLSDLPPAVKAPALTGRGMMSALNIFSDSEPLVCSLVRPESGSQLACLSMGPHSVVRYVLPLGYEFCFLEGFSLDLVSSPIDGVSSPINNWSMTWQARHLSTVTGCEYCGTAYFDWPAGGNCRQCGGALPQPLVNPSGRFSTSVRDGKREIVALSLLRSDTLPRCVHCGVIHTHDKACYACGYEPALVTV